MSRLRYLSLGACAALALGCSSGECSPGQRIGVAQDGSDVEFTWQPACHVSEVTVYEQSTGQVVWSIRGRIEPPVVYGRTRAEWAVNVEPAALVGETAYEVLLWSDRGGDSALAGSQVFIFAAPN